MPELLGVSAGIRDRIPAKALRFILRGSMVSRVRMADTAPGTDKL
jgi:hypothetical protein